MLSQSDTVWIFFDATSRLQTEELNSRQAKDFFDSIAPEDHSKWFAWRTSWDSWKALSEVAEHLQARQQTQPPELPVLPPPPSAIEEVSRSERRRFLRHSMRLKVVVVSGRRTFRTFSNDVSIGGIALEHAIPQRLLDEDCMIFLSGPDQRETVRFRLQPTGREDLRFFSFLQQNESFEDRLQRWLCVERKTA